MQIEPSRLIDALPGMVLITDCKGRTELVNQRWREYCGLSLEQLSGHGWQAAIHADDLPAFDSTYTVIRRSGTSGEIEVRLRRFDGQYRWFTLWLAPLSEGQDETSEWCVTASCSDEKSAGTPDGRLRRFVDALPTQVIFLTPSGALEYVSQEALDFFGQTFEELQNWATSGVIHPNDLGDVFERLQRTLTQGAVFDSTVRMRRNDGAYVWIRARMNPSRDAHGNIVRYCSIQSDVGHLKRAEALLSGEVRVLEMVGRGLPLPDVLEALCRLAEEIAGNVFSSILLVEDGARFRVGAGPTLPHSYNSVFDGLAIDPVMSCCSLAVTSKSPVISPNLADDERWRSSDWPPLSARHGLNSCWSMPIFSACDEVLGVFSIYRGTTLGPTESERELIDRLARIAGIAIEGAQTVAALRASETELRRAHTHLTAGQRLSRTGSFTWDVLADDHTWSEEIYRIFGFEPGVRVTMPMIQSAIHSEDMPAVEALLGRAVESTHFDLVFRIVTKDGAIRFAHVVGHRSEHITDRPVFLGALRDLTESKAAEEALSNARAELAHVTRVMTFGALTASIAHEVNQPLSGVITNANTCLRMLAAESPNVDGARSTAQRILRDGHRAAEVIRSLRELFARKPPTRADVDLNDAAREVLALCASELRRSLVIVRTDFDATLPAVHGDRVQLQQVILNLVLNAADSMREIEDRPRNMLIETTRDGEDRVRLSVRDSGVGIDPQHLPKLFDALYTTKSHGMGMGLSISRSIIESHQGRLWASANDGPGATFWFAIASRESPVP